ncbi:hypothetical protein BDV23DRAFT_173620 [Aspergillus alliaceus]|uniref:Major facilitator superfamily domain-containing protein n=1 Tax=Petromyces alliaceus TaxID=209559 RepID=A0A5N7C4Z9_PETAA|nr:hypothetical protein BDV23DRAFT_173620 [Aspergillus alliaceus]
MDPYKTGNIQATDVAKDRTQTNLVEPEDVPEYRTFYTTATTRSVFDDSNLAKYYQPHPQNENLHQRSVRQKTDFKVFLWILAVFFGLNIDRGNLGNASADNHLPDLGINTNDYNNAQDMYRTGFLIAEIPSQMIGKRLGPDRWIPVQIIL